jgi:DNA invertase Pin-like site-specific DNA recombinase
MKIKYNRVSTMSQSGDRFSIDNDTYDLTLMDRVSGSIPFMQRPKAIQIVKLAEEGKLKELVVEEFSRLGRNTGDLINTLEWFDKKNVNIRILNNGLQSRPNGKRNPVWKMISSVMSSVYEMELENIRERTMMGRAIYLQKGGALGRPEGSCENERKFIQKRKCQEIIKMLNKKRTIREISILTCASNKTIIKVKRIGRKLGMIK